MNRLRPFVLAALTALCLVPTARADEVKIAIFPSNDPAKLARVMAGLARYLEEKTGDTVTAVVTRDYEELAVRLRKKSVDIAWINTLNYVKATREVSSVRYMATYMERNEHTGRITPYYQSYIVARTDSEIANLDGLKGKRFAFTDKASTSGYGYPNLLLRKRGIDPHTYFRKVFFLKRHDRVVEALLAGSIEGGAISDGTYFTTERRYGDVFSILAKSAPIPLDAIVSSGSLPPARVAVYTAAFTTMPPDHPFCKGMREILGWSAAGFQRRDDAFYDSAREALGP